MTGFSMRWAAMAVVVGMVAACGGDGASAVSSEADGTMKATVGNLGQWSADKSIEATYSGGTLTITGTEQTGRTTKITLIGVDYEPSNPDKPQTFAFYGQATVQQYGFAQYSEGASHNFSTTQTGGSGSVTLTRLTDTRAVGTFTFTAVRSVITPGPPGTQDIFRRLMGGEFDVRLR